MLARRIVDITLAAGALVILSPLLLLTAIAVSLDSRGGPFYRAQRVGKDGRIFGMWKFRTMVPEADRYAPITAARDSRVTRLGKILRPTKLDELPQFWNLLTGDLTLVGPRPEAPGLIGYYEAEHLPVLKVKPGITGPTQIEFSQREAAEIPTGQHTERFYMEKFAFPKIARDLEYERDRTVLSDIAILLKTVRYMSTALFK